MQRAIHICMALALNCLIIYASIPNARAEGTLSEAAPWTGKTDSIENLVLHNFGPWAFSEKGMNAGSGPSAPPTLFKWEGAIEIAIVDADAPKEIREIRRWIDRLGRYLPQGITISPTVTPRTGIAFILKRERDSADMRPALQQALSAKYQADIPLYPAWKTPAWCQTLLFSRDIVRVRPLPLLPFLWRKIAHNEHPIDFVVVAIQADFDNLDPARFTQRTRDLMRTACIAEETLHALTGWQDIADRGHDSTILNNDPERHSGARGAEAEAIMKHQLIEPTRADLMGLRVLYDRRLRSGMTEDEARATVTRILTHMKARQ